MCPTVRRVVDLRRVHLVAAEGRVGGLWGGHLEEVGEVVDAGFEVSHAAPGASPSVSVAAVAALTAVLTSVVAMDMGILCGADSVPVVPALVSSTMMPVGVTVPMSMVMAVAVLVSLRDALVYGFSSDHGDDGAFLRSLVSSFFPRCSSSSSSSSP